MNIDYQPTHYPSLALEAIDFQNNSFFNALVAVVKEIRDNRDFTTRDIEKYNIPKIIKNYSNMDISVKVHKTLALQLALETPILSKNHVLLPEWLQQKSRNGIDSLLDAAKLVTGTTNNATGMVGGVYSDVPLVIHISAGMLSYKQLTNEEIAAGLLHEIGHGYSYFETFSLLCRTTGVLSGVARAMYAIDNSIERADYITKASKALGVVVEDVGALANLPESTRAQTVSTVLVSKHAIATRSETGYTAYEALASEQRADQYAVRQGAGRHLATLSDKLLRLSGEVSTISTTRHLATEFLAIAINALSGSLANLLVTYAIVGKAVFILPDIFKICASMALSLIFTDMTGRIYDVGEERVQLIKRDLVNRIKDKDIIPEIREATLRDIEVIDSVLSKLDYKRGFYEVIVTTFGPRGSREYKQEKIQKNIENLLTSDLYVHANKFQTGAA